MSNLFKCVYNNSFWNSRETGTAIGGWIMRKLYSLLAGALVACCLLGTAWAQGADDAYGFTADEIAQNQGAVAYWYAHGFANAFGGFPSNFAELGDHGLPLRDFFSPHTGDAINFDDGTLDFDGDMMYVPGDWDVEIHVQTSEGVFVLPGAIGGTDDCCRTFCCEIAICGFDCWEVCDDQDAACKIMQWMMWESFETYECRYGTRPCDVKTWMASGFAPIGANWRELAPFMDIEYVYGNCSVKKAYVTCCAPCEPKCKSDCGGCNKCAKDNCVKCKQDTCTTCKPKCAPENKCGKCDDCKPKCKPDCKKECCAKPACKPDCKKACCAKDKCVKCKQDTCTTCKPKCATC